MVAIQGPETLLPRPLQARTQNSMGKMQFLHPEITVHNNKN